MAGRKGRKQDAVPRIGDVAALPPEFDALQALIDTSDQPVFALDRDLRYTAFNRAHAATMRALYGVEIALGGRLADYQTVDADREIAKPNLERALAGERVVASAFSGERGRERFFDIVHTPLTDAVGTVVGVDVHAYDVTERKRAEAALQANVRERSVIYANVRDVVFHLAVEPDDRLRFVLVNAAFLEVTGLTEDQVVGKLFQEVIPEPACDMVLGNYKEAVRTRKAVSWEEVSDYPTGKRYGEVSVAPIYGADETCTHLIGIVHDITERVQTEKDLRESAATLRAVLDATPFPVALVDVQDDVIDFWSRSALTLFGHIAPTTAEWYEMAYPDPEYRQEVIDRWEPFLEEARLSGQAVNTGEYRVACRDGSVRICELHATFLADRLVVTFNDITERKTAEEHLAAAAFEWRQTFDAMRDSVAVFDRDGRVLRCNAATTVLTGRGFEDIVGRPCYEVFHDTHEYHADCPQRRAFESGQVETSFMEQNGQWLRFSFEPMIDAAGRVSGGVHVVTDVTELKQTERRLLESIDKQQAITDGVIAALARSVAVRDPYTAGHERRVSELATAIARHLALDEESLRGVQVAGTLHDVGKIIIPAEILSKPGRLSATEFELIKGHAKAGFDVLSAIDFPWPVAEITLQHHERLDGSGYPAGLTGESILPQARILAVADVVEAMISHRPYRAALPLADAMTELEEGAGSRYDAAACEAANRLFREQGFTFSE